MFTFDAITLKTLAVNKGKCLLQQQHGCLANQQLSEKNYYHLTYTQKSKQNTVASVCLLILKCLEHKHATLNETHTSNRMDCVMFDMAKAAPRNISRHEYCLATFN